MNETATLILKFLFTLYFILSVWIYYYLYLKMKQYEKTLKASVEFIKNIQKIKDQYFSIILELSIKTNELNEKIKNLESKLNK